MWYIITAEFENGKTRTYEVKGMIEAMQMIARLKATSECAFNDNKLKSYKITEA